MVAKKYIWGYIGTYVICFFIFKAIRCDFIRDGEKMPVVIDSRAGQGYLFDAGYVRDAKTVGYDHTNYFKSFFLLDILFPVIYTLLFLSCLEACKNIIWYRRFCWLIMTGLVLDYAENATFAIYLLVDADFLAPVVAFFTTLKTGVFLFNHAVALYFMGKGWFARNRIN